MFGSATVYHDGACGPPSAERRGRTVLSTGVPEGEAGTGGRVRNRGRIRIRSRPPAPHPATGGLLLARLGPGQPLAHGFHVRRWIQLWELGQGPVRSSQASRTGGHGRVGTEPDM